MRLAAVDYLPTLGAEQQYLCPTWQSPQGGSLWTGNSGQDRLEEVYLTSQRYSPLLNYDRFRRGYLCSRQRLKPAILSAIKDYL